MKVSDVMHRQADWVEADTPVAEAVRMMKIDEIGAVPVIEGNRRLAGIPSLGDVSHGVGGNGSADLPGAVSAHHA